MPPKYYKMRIWSPMIGRVIIRRCSCLNWAFDGRYCGDAIIIIIVIVDRMNVDLDFGLWILLAAMAARQYPTSVLLHELSHRSRTPDRSFSYILLQRPPNWRYCTSTFPTLPPNIFVSRHHNFNTFHSYNSVLFCWVDAPRNTTS